MCYNVKSTHKYQKRLLHKRLHVGFIIKPAKWLLMNRNDVPKIRKQMPRAPLVLMLDGPGRVVTVDSSETSTINIIYAMTI